LLHRSVGESVDCGLGGCFAGWLSSESQQGSEAHLRIAVGDHATFEQGGSLAAGSNHLDRVTAHAGRAMLERCDCCCNSIAAVVGQSIETAQRLQGMDCSSVEADRVNGLVADKLYELRHDVSLAPLNEQPLGMRSPEHVVALEGVDELFGTCSGE
jgi:hypothetical protein